MEGGQLILSVSGIRGIVGTDLTPGLVARLVHAWEQTLGPGALVLGRDSRPSGRELHAVARASLLQAGRRVFDVDVVPTPTLGLAVRCLKATAGLQITASHNPPQWNGLKMFTAQGRVVPPAESAPLLEHLRSVLAEVDSKPYGPPPWQAGRDDGRACVYCASQVLEAHLQAVLACVNGEAIRRRRFRVLVDGNGGAGGPLAVQLLDALGCRTTPIHCQADGNFHHELEPSPSSLREIAPLVAQCGCDLGFALDTDADRLVLLDETGHCLSEETTLALAVEARLRQQPGPVVINLSTSLVVEELCHRRGYPCYRTAVGEAHVVDGLLAHGAVIGGEGNGGVIDPRIGLVRDPFIAMALVLELLAELNQPVSALVASLPKWSMRKEKIPKPREPWSLLRERLLQGITAPQVDQRDGLYFRWPDRWLHVRPSNTEPIIRILAESPSVGETEQLIQVARQILSPP
ncbi:MAG: phosphoglucosamine mutase [Gemmatales bacterium]|nr:phosphoglucosamine mutase [Gemmatales bacterium]MDW7995075.1 phosphoglucosamine mutase [Gemmatales bacterium]